MPPDWSDSLSEFNADGLAAMPEDFAAMEDEAGADLDDETQDKVKGLEADLAYRTHRRNTCLDLQHVKAACDHIERLPEPGEAIHMVVSGRYPLFAIIPAVLKLSGSTIDELHIVTLSYSKDNAADLISLIESQQIGKVWLLVSHYFAHANPTLYDPLSNYLESNGHRALAMRTHAKIFLMKLADGSRFTVHASANARSCKNIEQACFENDPALYDFHRRWIDGLFAKAVTDAKQPQEA